MGTMKVFSVLFGLAVSDVIAKYDPTRNCHPHAPDFETCRGLCSFTEDCYFWSWKRQDDKCYLKHSSGWHMVRDDRYISGDVEGNIIWGGYHLTYGDVNC